MQVVQLSDLWAIDSRLAQLGRGVGRMRLSIGEGLCKLDALGGIQSLGYPTLDSYAREALGRSGRWTSDARALARRLARLPAVRAALVSGALTTSMVELVVRVATPDDEVVWVERAQTMKVRSMRAQLAATHLIDIEDAPPAPRSTITMTVDRVEAWTFERARAMVEAVGAARGDGAIEAILAEGLGELLAHDGDLDLPSGVCGSDIEAIDDRALRRELTLLREQCEGAADAAIPTEIAPVILADHREPDFSDDIADLHEQLRAAARELAQRDLELARLARRALDQELWKILRFRSFDHYCRERIGLSPSSVATRIALARRTDLLPEVAEAIASGRIGYEAATLIARIAGRHTVHAWIERAEVRTVKHLREEVDAVELVARVANRDVRREGPPDAATLHDVHEVERAASAVVMGQMSGSTRAEDEVAVAALADDATAHVSFGRCRAVLAWARTGARARRRGRVVRRVPRARRHEELERSPRRTRRLRGRLPARSLALRVAGVSIAQRDTASRRLPEPRRR